VRATGRKRLLKRETTMEDWSGRPFHAVKNAIDWSIVTVDEVNDNDRLAGWGC